MVTLNKLVKDVEKVGTLISGIETALKGMVKDTRKDGIKRLLEKVNKFEIQ